MTDHLDHLRAALADRYAIEREIGAGGMATVYVARDLKHDRRVAVKVLRPELAAAIGPDRFLREIKILARLQHPHILPLLDSGEAGAFLYYTMPLVDGESLRERIDREGALPVADAVRILREVADALTSSHAAGVLHRDIKPANVMLSGRHALVMDFGIAKAVHDAGNHRMTTVGLLIGTPTYMSPEQATGAEHLDARSDIYALGILAYEMLTGSPPFMGRTVQATLAAHMLETPRPVTEARETVSAALGDLVMKCLAKEPADRWQSTDELVPMLEGLTTDPLGAVAGEAVEADPWGADADNAFKLFLATPDEMLRATHRRLVADLGAKGIRVVASVPPPYAATEHATLVQSLVSRADLCVHLLGDRRGEPMEDGDGRQTYTLEQMQIGLEASRSQLVLMPERVDRGSIADAEYQAFVQQLVETPRDADRLELVRIGPHQMLAEILAKRERIDVARAKVLTTGQTRSAVQTAFVDLHSADLSSASDLIAHLGARRITPILMPAFDQAPTQALSMFEANLAKVPLFIVVFGSVTREWVINRLTAAVQFVTTHGVHTRIGVYLAPPVKSADQLRFPPFFDMVANMSGFDAGSIDALIERAAEEPA